MRSRIKPSQFRLLVLGKLVLMLFDGYLRFTTAATRAFDLEDFTKKNEGINNNLIRAQNIVTELQSSLDMSVPGDLPGTLYRLYDYVLNNLQQANLKKNKNLIAEADKVISELRDAWAEMLTQNPENPQQPPLNQVANQVPSRFVHNCASISSNR